MYHSFLFHSSADEHLGFAPWPGYYKQFCDEHCGTRVSFNSGFLSVYTQQWDFCVIRQIFIVKGNPGMLKLELTVSAQAEGNKKRERDDKVFCS